MAARRRQARLRGGPARRAATHEKRGAGRAPRPVVGGTQLELGGYSTCAERARCVCRAGAEWRRLACSAVEAQKHSTAR